MWSSAFKWTDWEKHKDDHGGTFSWLMDFCKYCWQKNAWHAQPSF